jgi:mRNA interferase MazF
MSFPLRGELWMIDLDPIIGSEIGKRRPALVISNDKSNEYSNTISVLPITSNILVVYPFEVFLSKEEYTLTTNSKIKCNQIRTVDKSRLIRKICYLKTQKMHEVEESLMIHLGIASRFGE